jgi:hypothetical protein
LLKPPPSKAAISTLALPQLQSPNCFRDGAHHTHGAHCTGADSCTYNLQLVTSCSQEWFFVRLNDEESGESIQIGSAQSLEEVNSQPGKSSPYILRINIRLSRVQAFKHRDQV